MGNAISQGQEHLSRDHEVKNTSLIAKNNHSFPKHNLWWPCYCFDVIYTLRFYIVYTFMLAPGKESGLEIISV